MFQAEAKLGFEIDKFIRKSDGSEVDDDDVLNHLFTEEKELWLVCLANGQEYSLGINFFLNIKSFEP